MKKIILFCSLLTIGFSSQIFATGITKLKAGDIAIVQINKAYQSFDFVPLVPITTGTTIVFSDMKYSASLKGFIPFGDPQYTGFHTFTATQNYAAGTVIQSYSNLSESKKILFNGTTGLSIIAFQPNDTTYIGIGIGGSNITVPKDTTFLTTIGWLAAENFKAGVNDIPPGLSIANNTVVKFDSTETSFNKYTYYSIKFDNMGDASKQEGTAIKLRRRFADSSNYLHSISTIQNTPVPNFNVLAPDLIKPTLVSSYPTQNKINVSPYSKVVLKFSEPMIAKKAITIKNTASGASQFVIPTDITISDSVASFSYGADLKYATGYTLEFQQGTFTDLDNHPWPATKDTIITFATSAKRSVVDLNFGEERHESEIIVYYFTRDNIQWTTTDRFLEYEQNYCKGYFSWEMFGIPLRWYSDRVYVKTDVDTPDMGELTSRIAAKIGLTTDRLVVDLSGVNNTITDVHSDVYENNCFINQEIYSGAQNFYSKQVTGTNYVKTQISYQNTDNVKIDSLVYGSLEGAVSRIRLEIVDQHIPTIELGNTKTICAGDSVLLDAGLTLGALYEWSTGAKTQKIWAKTSGNYSVTVKNSLGQANDNVQVIVKPTVSVSLPDTIYACVGDTVTLTAGTDISNSYFWSPAGQTTPSIKVTKSGIYHVLVNNGFGGCFTTDSTRVIFKGAKAHIGFNQGGMTGYNDVEGQLYKKNTNGKFEMFLAKNLPQFATFDSLPKGEYILKAHFVSYTFVGPNPFIDTYHDGKTEWSKVVPFKLTCETDTMFSFTLANKPNGYEFNGTGVISGKVVVSTPAGVRAFRVRSEITDTNGDILILLYDSSGNLISTTYPDANGNYSFTNLPAGNYSIGVERTGFTVQTLFTTSLPTGGTVSNANFTVNEDAQSIVQGLTTGIATISSGNFLQLSISPNPIKSSAILLISSENADNITISVVDFTGRICKSLNRTIEQGVNVIILNNDGFSGIYLVKVSTSTKMIVQRVIFE